MLYLLCPLVVCGECPESGLSGLGVATSNQSRSAPAQLWLTSAH